MTCPLDPAGNNLCMEMMRNNLFLLGQAEGVNCQVVFSETEPLAPDSWDAPYYCFHGVRYWVRPTDEQLAEWEQEENEVTERLRTRAHTAARLSNDAAQGIANVSGISA